MKTFNTTGTCNPNTHYMVNIDRQVEAAAQLVRQGKYFCINRGRQYGKTTTLAALSSHLSKEYLIFSISFEGTGDSAFATVENACAEFLTMLQIESTVNGSPSQLQSFLEELTPFGFDRISTTNFSKAVRQMCRLSSKPLVILVDEVDQASNNEGFVKFLGVLRKLFLEKEKHPTFLSVILAGVYDVKNLKLKIRSEEDRQYNSPWNIAATYDVDMSLSADGIAGMLAEYKADHYCSFDEKHVARMLHDYTSGYPFLVSRLCQIIDEKHHTWDERGVLEAVNAILMERNTLFDSMIKRIDDIPELKEMLKRILFSGIREAYNPDEKYLQIASMFNYIANKDGQVVVACRIMETRLYNYFLAERKTSKAFLNGQADRDEFIHDGIINMPQLLKRFCVHMNETFRMDKDHSFLEVNAREIFLTYLRPIINGVGNYYIEAQTRSNDRMDVVIDYLGTRYVVELKIWRGNAYNERGEEQLCRYLEHFNLQTGYLLSFCFNKKKNTGLLPPVTLNGRTLIEARV